VVRDGEVVERVHGTAQVIQPGYDRRIERSVKVHFDRFHSLSLDHFKVNDVDFALKDAERFRAVPVSNRPAPVQTCR
jgi:formylmethanofuran dehydrogenase subunit A